MKRILNLMCAAFAAAALFVSCSKDGDTLLSKVPADAGYVVYGKMGTIVESAGGKVSGDKVEIPEWLREDKIDFGIEKYADSGLDLSEIAGWVESANSDFYIVMAIDDPSKFETFLADNEYVKTGENSGYTFYSSDTYRFSPYCATGNGFAYFYDGKVDNAEEADKFNKAASKPITSTAAGKYIAKGNGGGFAMCLKMFEKELPYYMEAFSDYTICGQLSLDKDEAELDFVCLDDKGNRISGLPTGEAMPFKSSAKISSDALAYLAPSECLAYAVALKDVDWDSVADTLCKLLDLRGSEKLMLGMAKEYLSKIDGTVALGIGFDGDINALEKFQQGTLSYVPATLVVQTAPGKAKGLVGDLMALFKTFGVKTTELGDGFSVMLPDDFGMMYAKEIGNMIVVSTRPIEKYGESPLVKNTSLTSYIAGCGLYLPAEYPIMRDLDINDNLMLRAVCDLDDQEAEIKLKITGETKGGIMARLLTVAHKISLKVKSLRQEQAFESDFTPVEEPTELPVELYYEE